MSHRRKHVTAGLLDEQLEPQARQRIVRAVGARGGNVVEVETADARRTLVMLPSRFNKKLWVKRGGYLLIEECPEAEADGGSKITGTIVNVYYDAQIKQLKKIPGVWPPEFDVRIVSQEGEGTILACTSDVPDVNGTAGDDQTSFCHGVTQAAAALERTHLACDTSTRAAADADETDAAARLAGTGPHLAGSTAAGGPGSASAVVDTAPGAPPDEGSCTESDDDDLPPLYQNNNRRIIYHEEDSESEEEEEEEGRG